MQNVRTHSQGHFWDSASQHASPAEIEVQRLITALLRPGDWLGRAVLDAGCGNGDYSAAFLQAEAGRVTGVDVSADSLKTACAKAPGAAFYAASLSDLPFRAESFDVIWSWGVLHYVPDPARALRELARVLRPGGVAVIHVRGDHFWSGVQLSLQRVLSGSPRPVQRVVLEAGSAAISGLTLARTGKRPEAHTAKSVRQKIQEQLLAPGQQCVFSLADVQSGLGKGFALTQVYPPVANLLSRDMSLTVIARKVQSGM